jgi:hypothetical protein
MILGHSSSLSIKFQVIPKCTIPRFVFCRYRTLISKKTFHSPCPPWMEQGDRSNLSTCPPKKGNSNICFDVPFFLYFRDRATVLSTRTKHLFCLLSVPGTIAFHLRPPSLKSSLHFPLVQKPRLSLESTTGCLLYFHTYKRLIYLFL